MNWDELYTKEWRELGFYYLKDDHLKQWWLMGSKEGLSEFIVGLRKYANNSNNDDISQHIHIGPHSYLKILTRKKPEINNNYIGGSLIDLSYLADLIEQKLSLTDIGNIFTVGSEYALDNEYSIRFFVMAYGFDPSQIEHEIIIN